MLKQIRTPLLAGAIVVFVLMGTLAQVSAPSPGRGEEWLSWSPTERRVFVAAYLDGYLRGKTDACIAAGELFEQQKPVHDLEDTPDRKCFRHAKSYSRTADDYAGVLTSFYSEQKEHRNIPVEYFLMLFTDARYQTVADIEQGMRKGEVRTTF